MLLSEASLPPRRDSSLGSLKHCRALHARGGGGFWMQGCDGSCVYLPSSSLCEKQEVGVSVPVCRRGHLSADMAVGQSTQWQDTRSSQGHAGRFWDQACVGP